ncbi:MAG: ABC transporter permease [Phycisphaeraceae bacterium]|nr:ABC transporter permease [Phycisphaeraceae bacterium]
MFAQFRSIAGNTFTQSIRQPIFTVLVLIGLLAMVLNPTLAAYTLEDDNLFMLDMGLSMIGLVCLLLAAFTATGVVSEEIEQRTALTVLSKPVRRPIFVAGKFAGVAGGLAVAFVILALAFLLTVRHQVMQTASEHFDGPVLVFGLAALALAFLLATGGNYLYRWAFNATLIWALLGFLGSAYGLVLLINRDWQFQGILTEFQAHAKDIHHTDLGQLLVALGLVFQATLILVATAIAASTRLKQVMTLLVCLGVFLGGLVNDSICGPWLRTHAWTSLKGPGEVAQWLGLTTLYNLLPNLQLLWVADALKQRHVIPLEFVGSVTGYSLLYGAALLLLAVILFQEREIG